MALLFFGSGSTIGHSFVSVDDFSQYYGQKFFNQVGFDFLFDCTDVPEASATFGVLFCLFGERGLEEAPREGEAS